MNIVNHVLKTTEQYRITSPFGMRRLTIGGRTINDMHNGIDLVPRADIISPARGKVIKVIDHVKESQTPEIIAKKQTSLYYGNAVYIQHGNNVVTRFAHLRSGSIPVDIKVGMIVEKGHVLGYMGTTGYSTGVHLHFETLENGVRVDPLPYLLGQKNFIDYYDVIPIYREGIPYLSINIASLIYRKTPNGERIGLLPLDSKLPYLGKSPNINGYEWAEVMFENQIVYCAMSPTWNTLFQPIKEVEKIVVKEVITEVTKPYDKTFEDGEVTLHLRVTPKK